MTEALLAGIAAAYATALVRLLPGIRGLVAEGVKPFACNTCMSFWASIPATLALREIDLSWPVVQCAAAGISLLALEVLGVIEAKRAAARQNPFGER